MASESVNGDNGSPWTDEKKVQFESKPHSKYYDPCQEAASRSLKCLQRNAGDKNMCEDYFDAYRACKKEWLRKKRGFGP
ncbi:uncharacterized protein PV09_06826 [Verruconis gallopava]|uniref:Cytochrome c oxidase-assembly factor COX23, mitochondrial n=1 Tax=Verruconis gallopava TaxID=253628 RepID=A0A0D2A557_9PEZI|nr:uncharacterized protein PV09_06826 [Verruconis gallopava]KIW01640.1 hypothetical protein PV09_06826 [Verruconis gallopava]